MNRKTKNTIMLLGVLAVIIIAGSSYSFFYQRGKLEENTARYDELSINSMDTDELIKQLDILKLKADQLDSILALRKFNIPLNLRQSRFFDFVNNVSRTFSPHSYVNIEYESLQSDENFNFYVYNLNGTAEFNDLYELVYSIEQSKELKKIISSNLNNFVKVDKGEIPHYLVSFVLKVQIYFSDNDRFASSNKKENMLKPNPLYDIFYPLIRNEIPPNSNNLLDVQTAQLLALVPDGAFMTDAKGATYLLWEGDEVYLGYLTEIDYQNNEVKFILNKGGIIDRITLTFDKAKKEAGQ